MSSAFSSQAAAAALPRFALRPTASSGVCRQVGRARWLTGEHPLAVGSRDFQPARVVFEVLAGAKKGGKRPAGGKRAPAPKNAPAATAAPKLDKQAIARLIDWMNESGANLTEKASFGRAPHKLRVKDSHPTRGRGLFARRDLSANETVISIPFPLVLRRGLVAQSDIGKRHPALAESGTAPPGVDPDLVSIAAFLLHERSRGDAAFWKPYLDVLPEATDSPLFWSEDELRMLQGTSILDEVDLINKGLRAEFDRLEAAAFSKDRSSFPASTLTFQAFRDLYCVLLSRSIPLGSTGGNEEANGTLVIPYMDFLNHDGYSTARLTASKAGGFLFDVPAAVSLYLDGALFDGSEVYANYNPQATSRFMLLHYGFMIFNTPRDTVTLTLSLDPERDPLYDSKLVLLRNLGLGPDQTFEILLNNFPQEAVAFARIALLESEEDLAAGERRLGPCRGARRSSGGAQIVSFDNEIAAHEVLLEAVKGKLRAYPSTLQEDEALLKATAPVAAKAEELIRAGMSKSATLALDGGEEGEEKEKEEEAPAKPAVVLEGRRRMAVQARRAELRIWETAASSLGRRLESLAFQRG
eukprot:tig00000658_g2915.t1